MKQSLILLVDDHSKNLQVLGNLLERDYTTAVAKNGFKALEFVERERPDLILLDIMMPEMDGFEVCRRLQASPDTKEIPIIFLSAKTELDAVVKGFELGAKDYVTKPFRKEELLARVNTHLQLKHSKDLLKQGLTEAQQLARIGSWSWDLQEASVTWSDELFRILGERPHAVSPEENTFLDFVHPDDRDDVKAAIDHALSDRTLLELDHRIIRSSGAERLVHSEVKGMFDEAGTPLRLLGTLQDLTERKQLEAELRKLSMVIEESINVVFITDLEGRMEYVNPMFERVTGYARAEILGQNPRILSSGETPKPRYENLWETILSGKAWRGELKNRKKNGKPYWIRAIVSPIKDETGQVTHFLSIQDDISDTVLAEQKALYLSTYDKSTGLLNRESFLDKLETLLSQKQCGVLILLNLDDFRLINEAYGHNLSDEFFKRLVGSIRNMLQVILVDQEFLMGRPGGNEIALYIPDRDGREALKIAEHIRMQVEKFTFSDEHIRATLSAGLVEFPQYGNSAPDLLRRAEAAMFRVKKIGKNACRLFSPEDWNVNIVHAELQRKERIINALEDERFEPWFQPILDLKESRVHHYEALARMRGEDGNIILPGAFIPTAESLGLIAAIDRMVSKKTIDYQAALKQQGHHVTFTINLSGKNLGDEQLLDFLESTIREAGADPQRLIFEITETEAIRDMGRALAFIGALKSLGCRFALDDFGVGFTSFVYLKELDVDFIKIDGSFIRRLHEHKADQGITRAMTTVAKSMGMKTIAEFVEQEATLDFLREFGVDYAQGFLIGQPSPFPQLSE